VEHLPVSQRLDDLVVVRRALEIVAGDEEMVDAHGVSVVVEVGERLTGSGQLGKVDRLRRVEESDQLVDQVICAGDRLVGFLEKALRRRHALSQALVDGLGHDLRALHRHVDTRREDRVDECRGVADEREVVAPLLVTHI
jgi:hypothetical protein